MIKRIFSLLMLCVVCQLSFAQTVKKIAVLETIDQENRIPHGVELSVRSWMTIAIAEFEGYEAYDRINVSSMLGEHEFQRTGYVSPESIKKLGQMVGVDYLLISEIGYVDNINIIIVTRLIDITTTQVVKIGNYQTATDAQSISSACRALAGYLFNGQSYNNTVVSGREALTPQTTSSSIPSFKKSVPDNAVDLGLSVYWSDRNIGASSSKDKGNEFWFEDAVKAASCVGNGWRLPTEEECKELINLCQWTKKDNGKGWQITGLNGNSIYLPTNLLVQEEWGKGLGEYWTSTQYPSGNIGFLTFGIAVVEFYKRVNRHGRRDCRYESERRGVRLVLDK